MTDGERDSEDRRESSESPAHRRDSLEQQREPPERRHGAAECSPGRATQLAREPELAPARERWSWALYDFANTIFSMNVATYYFNVWLISDLGSSSTKVTLGNTLSSLLVVLSIPIFSAISDARRRRVPWVIAFTLLSCLATAAIGVIGHTLVPLVGDCVEGAQGTVPRDPSWHIGGSALFFVVVAFVVANYAYQGAIPFYNAMLSDLAPPAQRGRLSGIGTAVGYLGSIVGIALTAPFFNGTLPVIGALPDRFVAAIRGFVPFTEHGGRVASFVPTAIFFLLFSLPLFFFCRDHDPAVGRASIDARGAFRSLRDTFRRSRNYPGSRRFILASLMYQDAIGTIISFFAVYAVKVVKFDKGEEISLFVVLTLPAVLGSYLAGHVVDRIGPKRTMIATLVAWIVLLAALIAFPERTAFWIIGSCIGFIFGNVWTAERPLLLSLVPREEAGQFFGFMVLSARAAAIVGPMLWAASVDLLEEPRGVRFAYRVAVATVGLGFVGALVLLAGVPDRFRRAAPSLSGTSSV
jgi:UMF1 family MFS transporter